MKKRVVLLIILAAARRAAGCRVCERLRVPRAPLPLSSRRLPRDVVPRAAAGSDEVQLAECAAGFLLLVLVDAGRRPPDPSEEELANFGGGTAPLESLALTLLRGYKRAISPNLPKNCRFLPTCSEYAALAVKEFGILRGSVLATWRVARCNPLGGTGYDPPVWPPPPFDLGRR
ncbi:hypothetical protein CTAYLR_003252 [Chrysophaeum taylorii]|uniref:Membrane protein insertion efficiency factor n=1 Tax=Chrysophaeum taylorii TaxID=2483200 RepID=A0AAD7XMB7_9STRA|nr:hypothetical protein CTAYLR_003252 [Chrysophaeum taylorii]